MKHNRDLARVDPDTWFEGQTMERQALFADRAMRSLDLEGVPDEDDYMHEEFIEAMTYEANMAFLKDLVDSMIDRDLIEVVGIDENGERQLEITEKGILAID